MTLSLMVADDDDNYTRRDRMQPRPPSGVFTPATAHRASHRVSTHLLPPTTHPIGCLHTCGGVGGTSGGVYTCGERCRQRVPGGGKRRLFRDGHADISGQKGMF